MFLDHLKTYNLVKYVILEVSDLYIDDNDIYLLGVFHCLLFGLDFDFVGGFLF